MRKRRSASRLVLLLKKRGIAFIKKSLLYRFTRLARLLNRKVYIIIFTIVTRITLIDENTFILDKALQR